LKHAEQSEKHHQSMGKLRKKLKTLIDERKEYDQKFYDLKSEDSKIRKETRAYQESKIRKVKAKLVSKAKDIMEKFKKGEKITAEELKILQETEYK